MTRPVTVLLTCIGGAFGPEILRQLRQSQRFSPRLVGVDASPTAVGRHFADVFDVVVPGDQPGYAEHILALTEKEGVEVIVPGSDEEVLALAVRRDDFTRLGAALACPEAETARCLTDKAATYERVRDIGVPVPEYRLVHDFEAVELAASELGYPRKTLVLKPTRSRGGREVYIIKDGSGEHRPGQLSRVTSLTLSALKHFRRPLGEPCLLMPYLSGQVYDVDVLCRDGQAIHQVPRRRLNPYGIPFAGNVIETAPGLLETCARICQGLGLSYLYDFDVAFSEEHGPILLEINPRPSGSVAATVAVGVPIIDDLISLCLGETLQTCPVPYGRDIEPYSRLLVDGHPT